jgi:hypothetical protein
VSECDLETSKRKQPRPDLGCCATGKERKGKERKGKERKGKERKGKERKSIMMRYD